MNQIISIDPDKDPRWDQFVGTHPLGWVVHLSGWKKLLERCFPHMKGHYLALCNSATHELKAALPLFEVRSWLTGNRLVSIPMAQLSDPLVDSTDDLNKLLEAAFQLSQRLHTSHIELRTFHAPSLDHDKRLRADEFYKHHFIPLDKEPETLKRSFHNKAINQAIHRASRKGLRVKIADSEEDLKVFYRLFMQTRKSLGVPFMPYRFLKSLWDIFYPLNMAILLLAQQEDRTASGILFFQFNGRFSAEWEGWDREFSTHNPNHLIFWEGIKLAYQNGNSIFDFGITDPNNEGLVLFKNRWGTEVMNLHRYYYSEEPGGNFIEDEKSVKNRLLEGICKCSPDFIYRQFGNFCFRHMG